MLAGFAIYHDNTYITFSHVEKAAPLAVLSSSSSSHGFINFMLALHVERCLPKLGCLLGCLLGWLELGCLLDELGGARSPACLLCRQQQQQQQQQQQPAAGAAGAAAAAAVIDRSSQHMDAIYVYTHTSMYMNM